MANEAQVRASLQIRVGNGYYQSQPTVFNADVSTFNGPTPGAVTIDTGGIDIDLTQLTVPGFCWMQNLDSTNFVEYGIYDFETDVFYPFGELLPGEINIIRLSRNFGIEYEGVGTGTTGRTNRFRLKANTSSCVVRIDVFEK
jgi:hypothetical protein